MNAYVPSVRHPIATKIEPRISDCDQAAPLSGSMNCGRYDKKNSATFGLSVFTTTPWRNARGRDIDGIAPAIALGTVAKVRMPTNTK